MISATSYEQFIEQVHDRFSDLYPNGLEASHGVANPRRLLGMLFARPESQFTRENVLPGMRHYNVRSGRNVDFYLIGYADQVRYDITDTGNFNYRAFNEFREEVERQSCWRYGGEAELLLLNVHYDIARDIVELDFSSAIAFDLEQAAETGIIRSVDAFFEAVFRYAEAQDEADPAWGFAKAQAGWKRVSALQELLWTAVRNIPLVGGWYETQARTAFGAAVRDVSTGVC